MVCESEDEEEELEEGEGDMDSMDDEFLNGMRPLGLTASAIECEDALYGVRLQFLEMRGTEVKVCIG